MPITASQIKDIRQEFAKLKPATVTLDGNRVMTVKEAVFALAPTLERMKKRGFDVQEIVDRLHEKGIDIKPPTLSKYLNEYRRQKDSPKNKKRDTPPPRAITAKATAIAGRAAQHEDTRSSFIVQDTPLDEL